MRDGRRGCGEPGAPRGTPPPLIHENTSTGIHTGTFTDAVGEIPLPYYLTASAPAGRTRERPQGAPGASTNVNASSRLHLAIYMGNLQTYRAGGGTSTQGNRPQRADRPHPEQPPRPQRSDPKGGRTGGSTGGRTGKRRGRFPWRNGHPPALYPPPIIHMGLVGICEKHVIPRNIDLPIIIGHVHIHPLAIVPYVPLTQHLAPVSRLVQLD